MLAIISQCAKYFGNLLGSVCFYFIMPTYYYHQFMYNFLKLHTKTKGGCTMFGWAYFCWQIIKIKIKISCVKVQLNPKKCEVLKSCT